MSVFSDEMQSWIDEENIVWDDTLECWCEESCDDDEEYFYIYVCDNDEQLIQLYNNITKP